MKKIFLLALALAFAPVLCAEDQIESFVGENVGKTLKVSADRIAVDRNTEALFATGHVLAVSAPMRLHTDFLERDTNGVCRMGKESSLTTCTNCPGHLHWEIKGEVEYQEGDHVLLRNAWIRFFEVPIFWLPYFYYPIGGEYGFEIMPGYTSRWGAYLMTKANYTIFGDPRTGTDGKWLNGATRFDLRWENGVAIGEDLKWSLGDWGNGNFKIYYAWDQDYERHGVGRTDSNGYSAGNWGSVVPYNRYVIDLDHRIELTERDVVRGKFEYLSDTFIKEDFFRTASFSIKNKAAGYTGNELAWEHTENLWGLGVSVSGPINEFLSGTRRLPEIYFDVAPTPVWKLPINYETQNRLGFLQRHAARYEGATSDIYGSNPGVWANYESIRFDTYHRFSASFKPWDVLSIVPRIGYHGTYWNQTGDTVLYGLSDSGANKDNAWRSIFEAGVTFAGRGTAWINEKHQHMIEPYFDVLAQQSVLSGLGTNHRPYIFDSIDASSDWSDQFAGRSRNLPYSWYGATPGVRNVLSDVDEHGVMHTIFNLDVYAALQINTTDWIGDSDSHKLVDDVKDPNYGKRFMPVPGGRLRWFPLDDAYLGVSAEYDSEYNRLARAELLWRHRVSRNFSYHVSYFSRDHRYWDYSSSPVDEASQFDGFNWAKFGYVELGFEHEVCDAFAWAPYIRWDCRQNELDEVGAWIDFFRTDCIGFRFNVAYENEYTRIDGSREDEEWRIGFYIYLRALGPNQGLQIGD